MPRVRPPDGSFLYVLGNFIRQWRLSRGLTQHDLGVLIGHSWQAVRSWEQGLMGPDVETLMRIAAACDMPFSAFVAPLDDTELAAREPRTRREPL